MVVSVNLIIYNLGMKYVIYKLRSVQNTGTCYSGHGWFVRNLAEAQVSLTNPAEAWVACPGILHRS